MFSGFKTKAFRFLILNLFQEGHGFSRAALQVS